MMEQIDELALRTTDGPNLDFAWGGNAWPVTWYFRNLNNATFFGQNPTLQAVDGRAAVYASQDIRARVEPLLEDRYYRFEYIRMWWPMQDYFNLTPQRVTNALDFSPTNTQASEIRLGMFDIWWSRDYTRYGQAVGTDFSLQNWPVAERLYFYVRKDIAAQVWNLGVGDGIAFVPPEAVTTVNQCTANWQTRFADVIFSPPAPLINPLDIAVSDDGRVYVAEEFGNRISVFDTNGSYITALDGNTTDPNLALNRPNGVAVDPSGNLYVADTWNYRIRAFSPSFDLLTGWGQIGQFSFDAPAEPVDGFWGPRDVFVDDAGRVFVSDTGNKRVRVYDLNGQYLYDVGSGGSAFGQLDEPAGVAVSADGRLFVADTWNRRVSVFNAATGDPQMVFEVNAWYEDLGSRPYLAVDDQRGLLYVTDPNAGRVLVYDLLGNCIGAFGQPTDQPSDGSQFDTIGGITTDAAGNVYVVDNAAGRVLRFAPFVESAPAVDPLAGQPIAPEATAEVGPLLPEETIELLGGVAEGEEQAPITAATEELTAEISGGVMGEATGAITAP
ncbi:MAG: hypothetical protein GYB67_11950 [Chloroflexi bacterium]|nr:hypothetical protein [Chloroflexota bacterium]